MTSEFKAVAVANAARRGRSRRGIDGGGNEGEDGEMDHEHRISALEELAPTLATKRDLAEHQLATKNDIAELRQATKDDFAELRQATKDDIAELRQSTKDDIAELRQSTKDDIAELRQSTKDDIAELRQSTKDDFAELRLSTKEDIAELRLSTKLDIAGIRSDLHKMDASVKTWMVGTITGLFIGFAGLFLTMNNAARTPAQPSIPALATAPGQVAPDTSMSGS